MPDEIPLSSAPLSEDIVEILGKKSTPPTLTGPKIHEDLVSRWKIVLNAGLSDDERSSLLSKLPPPKNFQIVSAPRLNAVVQKALSPSNLSRDERLAKLQNVVAASLAGVGQVCSMILAEEGGGDRRYIELLNNTGRLLADLWHSQNTTRRDLISINLSKEFQEVTEEVPLDTYLFGENLDEKMKANKTSEDYGKILKAKTTKTTSKGAHHAIPTSSRQRVPVTARALNYRAPSRWQKGTTRERSRYYQTVPIQHKSKPQLKQQRGRMNR
ncbi:unnamed protein product [Callosobruchus maculatus]|uniref:Uncharacterized protein n=1 Tax=Callosobruchus maculatus TaxID=64391 RepID=A0A653BMN9_CALMS|nr:unnamed protein product [Callosobruchus maculatus]